MKTIQVQFKQEGKVYNFNDTTDKAEVGDYVAVITINGFSIVEVVGIEEEYENWRTPILSILSVDLPADEMYYSFLTYQKGRDNNIIRKESKKYDRLYFINLLFKDVKTIGKKYAVKCKDNSEYSNSVRIIFLSQELDNFKLNVIEEYEHEPEFTRIYLSQLGYEIQPAPVIKGEYFINSEKGQDIEDTYEISLYPFDSIKDYLSSLAPENSRLYIVREWMGTETVLDDEDGNLADWAKDIIKNDKDVFKRFWLDDLTYYQYIFLSSKPCQPLKNDIHNIIQEELYAKGKYDCFVFVETIDWENEEDFGTDYFYSIYTNALA